MATVFNDAFGSTATLCTGQTGNGDSTNIWDRGNLRGPALLTIVSTIGGSPTVTVTIQGSMDGSVWWSIPYSLPATPETLAVAALTITTAVTGNYILRGSHPWRFMKLLLASNNNVTLTATVTP